MARNEKAGVVLGVMEEAGSRLGMRHGIEW